MSLSLETDRLILRPLTAEDADNLFQLDSDPQVMRYINGGIPTSYAAIVQNFLPTYTRVDPKFPHLRFWAALDQQNLDFVGWFHFIHVGQHPLALRLKLAAEDDIALGYRLHRNFWGKGYATEASRFLIQKGFQEWKVQRVVAWALRENLASTGVMKRLGMSLEQEFDFPADVLPNIPPEQRQGVKYGISYGV